MSLALVEGELPRGDSRETRPPSGRGRLIGMADRRDEKVFPVPFRTGPEGVEGKNAERGEKPVPDPTPIGGRGRGRVWERDANESDRDGLSELLFVSSERAGREGGGKKDNWDAGTRRISEVGDVASDKNQGSGSSADDAGGEIGGAESMAARRALVRGMYSTFLR
jgi:hypothetical protein